MPPGRAGRGTRRAVGRGRRRRPTACDPADRRRRAGGHHLHVRHHGPLEGRGADPQQLRWPTPRTSSPAGASPAPTATWPCCRSFTSTAWATASARGSPRGCRMRLAERFDAAKALELVRGLPADAVLRRADGLRPAAGAAGRRGARGIGARMRLFVWGSAPLPAAVLEAFRERFGHTILERYGMSETLMLASNPSRASGAPAPWAAAAGRVGAAAWTGRARRWPATRSARCWCAGRTSSPATGPTRRRPRAAFATAGSGPATSRARRRRLLHAARPRNGPDHLGRLQHLSARDRGGARSSSPACARRRWSARPIPCRGEVPVGLRRRRSTMSTPTPRETLRASLASFKAPRTSSASTRCRGTRWASCRSICFPESSIRMKSSDSRRELHDFPLRILDRPLFERRVVHAERCRFGGCALDVPLVHDQPLDEPHRGRAAATAAVDERRLIGRLRNLGEEPIGGSGFRRLETERDVDVSSGSPPSPQRPAPSTSAPASLASRRFTTDAKPIFLMAGIASADVAPAHATVVSRRLKLRTPFTSSVVTC